MENNQITNGEQCFYDEIVKNLKEEAKKLNKKLTTISNNNGDYNTYIAILKSLRETLNLINEYDWQLHYSEYETIGENNSRTKQVAVWKQNSDNQIKNHIVWNIEQKVDLDKLTKGIIDNIKNQLNKNGILR
jgi:glycerol kinase